MSNRLGNKIDRRLREELQIAAAMAKERILETHVRQLLELIQITEKHLSIKKATEIYMQLHSVDQDTARQIASKTLAALGQSRETGSPLKLDTITTDAETTLSAESGPDSRPSLFAQIRTRLSGGINPDLRDRIELHTGRTQVALLHVHVDNTLRFVQILTPAQNIATAAEIYHEMTNVRRSVAEVVYFIVLDRLSGTDRRGPGRETSEPKLSEPAVEPTLRIVNK
jgi:hypothetical protein